MKFYSLLLFMLVIAFACKSEDIKPSSNIAKDIKMTKEPDQNIKEPRTTVNPPPQEKSVIKDVSEKNGDLPNKNLPAEKTKTKQEKEPAKKVTQENAPKLNSTGNSENIATTKTASLVTKPETNKPPKPPEKINHIEFELDDPENPINTKDDLESIAFDHSAFNQLLKKYVSDQGEVDYKGFKSAESQLDDYLSYLDIAKPSKTVSKAERLAYWINAYNAFTIKLILKNYPLKSIMDLHGGKPWDRQWITLAGQSYSLNNIENDIIRPIFQEPRIHFAVNCAAKSCPPLAPEAFTADNLERLLDKRTKQFVNNTNYNQLSNGNITLSKIFDWYAKDFMNVASFVSKYADTKIGKSPSISYNEYDWSLNGK